MVQTGHMWHPHGMSEQTKLLAEVRGALSLNQTELASALGFSARTGIRWAAGHSSLTEDAWRELSRRVHPVDVALAAALARRGQTTLRDLGLEVVKPPIAAPPAPPTVPPELAREAVDAVVCAAADAMNVVPQAIRPALLAAFVKARKLALSVRDVEAALSAKPRPVL